MNNYSDFQQRILKKHSEDNDLNLDLNLTETQKRNLLLALGWEEMIKKLDSFNRNAKSIKYLCQAKLQTLFLLEKQAKNSVEKIDNSDYKKHYSIHKDSYINMLSFGEQVWDVLISKHVFDHVNSNISKYKSWLLAEKMKHARWLSPSFSAKNRQKQSYINKKYLSLDPEKIESSIVNFLKTGELQKKKYTPAEELALKQRFLDNHNNCKEILFWYEALVIPKNEWYSEEITERIVKLKKEDKSVWYFVSENIPIRFTEDHLRKYRGNEFSFEIFDKKESLIAYLKNQLFFISKQRERFQEAITYFAVYDNKAENKQNIENAYLWFSTHGTFTDQFITEKLEQLLSGEKRGRNEIIKSIIEQAKKWIKESQIKEKIMWEHYNAVVYNDLF